MSSNARRLITLAALVLAGCGTPNIIVGGDGSEAGDAADHAMIDSPMDRVDAVAPTDAQDLVTTDLGPDIADDTPVIDTPIVDAPDVIGVDAPDVVGVDAPDVIPVDAPDVTTASCAGAADGTSCTGGHCCGGMCVNNTDVAHCGARCSPCNATNGTATCDGTACGITCATGFGNCDSMADTGCESSLDTASHCGACGTSCSGSTPMCSASSGSATCVSGCSASEMLCGTSCANTQTDPAHCGSCTTSCPAPSNGSATCTAGTCGSTCNTGFHACGSACADDTAVATCGSRCAPCTAPANATATCTSGTCGFTCNTGFHNCGGSCVSNTSVLTCGTSCSACSTPPNSTATCDGTSCGFACDPGSHRCGSSCSLDTDATACGTSCMVCPTTTGGSATCVSGACGFVCDPGYVVTASGCTPAPPRPIGPLSTSIVTTRRPVLRWVLPTGVTGAHVQVCTDRACTAPVWESDATGTSIAVGTNLPVRTVYWRLFGTIGGVTGTVASPTWQFLVPAATTTRSNSWGSFADVNGDGFADLVASYPGTMMFPASSTGIATDATWSTTADRVYTAADVNGDGFADLVGGDVAGGIGVYFGSATGLPTTRSQAVVSTPLISQSLTFLGDVNGDGYADIGGRVGGSADPVVLFGSASGLQAIGQTFTRPTSSTDTFAGTDHFDLRMTGVGDLTGDGYDDVVASSYDYMSNTGRLYVFTGSAAGLNTTPVEIAAPVTMGVFGYRVAPAGDVNGDGNLDFVASAHSQSRAYVFHGNGSTVPTSPSTTLMPGALGFGLGVGGIGDFNSDGYSDIVAVSGSSTGGSSSAAVYLGSPGGIGSSAFVTLSRAGVVFVGALAAIGDANGDGRADVALVTGNGGGGWARADPNPIIFYGATTAAGVAVSVSDSLGNPAIPTLY